MRSLANIKDIICTLYRPYVNSAATTDEGKLHMTNVGQSLLKECNFLWGAQSQLLEDTNPDTRGIPDATTGVPAATAVEDAALPQTTFQIRIGAKMIPHVPMSGGNVVSHLKMPNGIESLRLGFNNLHSFENNKKCFAINLSLIHI